MLAREDSGGGHRAVERLALDIPGVQDVQCAASDGSVHSLVLSLSKDERLCSWFDKLTTSGYVSILRTRHMSVEASRLSRRSGPRLLGRRRLRRIGVPVLEVAGFTRPVDAGTGRQQRVGVSGVDGFERRQ